MGVADDETIPSRMQELCGAVSGLAVRVYNFSVAGFFSTQERGYFEKLLTTGTAPDVVARETRAVLETMRDRPGHIFNLGHGLTPGAKLENIAALVETVKHFK